MLYSHITYSEYEIFTLMKQLNNEKGKLKLQNGDVDDKQVISNTCITVWS